LASRPWSIHTTAGYPFDSDAAAIQDQKTNFDNPITASRSGILRNAAAVQHRHHVPHEHERAGGSAARHLAQGRQETRHFRCAGKIRSFLAVARALY
jgi:hypothetical protein